MQIQGRLRHQRIPDSPASARPDAGGGIPEQLSREQYAAIRERPQDFDPYMVGCAGFLASYNAKFFGGYAGTVQTKIGTVRDYYDEARRNLLKQAESFKGISFACMDYRRVDFRGCAIYCDPPYISATGYSGGPFDHVEFWNTMRRWSRENTVFISEQEAPDDFVCVWEGTVTRTQDNASRQTATEKALLFGHLYEKGFLVKTKDDKAPEVAVGYRAKKLNGKYEFVWLYVGTFGQGHDDEYETEADKVTTQTATLKGSFYARQMDGRYHISVDESNLLEGDTDAKTAIQDWFAKVQEKDAE